MPEKKGQARKLLVILALAVFLCAILTSCVTTSSGESVSIFTIILVRPFAWALRWIYEFVGNFGLALILFTLATRIILLPLNIKGKKGMQRMQVLQPQLKALEVKHKNDKKKYQEEVAKLYQKEGISPMSGCLPTLITLPIMFALYWPISQPLKHLMSLTADQISQVRDKLIAVGAKIGDIAISATSSEIALAQAIHDNFNAVKGISSNIIDINLNFLGMNLGATPSYRVFDALFLLPLISAGTAYLMSRVTTLLQTKATGTAPAQQNAMMTWMMPLISLWIGFTLPAGLAFYWILGNVFGIAQEYFITYYIMRQQANQPPEEAGNNDKKSRGNRKNKR